MANENLKLQDLINALNGTSIAQCEIPIMFQDITDETIKNSINEYQSLVTSGKYQEAVNFRVEHSEIEPYIIDANKLNAIVCVAASALSVSESNQHAIDISLEDYKNLDKPEDNVTYYIEDGDADSLGGNGENMFNGYNVQYVSQLPSDASNKKTTFYIVG